MSLRRRPSRPPPTPLALLTLALAHAPAQAGDELRVDELTVVGARESRTPGSAHVLQAKDLERQNQDNPETVVKSVPGVYARGEDGVGLRPNIGIRGTSPDRSKKITLLEDGVLFGPAPYSAPAAYYFPLITRMEQVRVIKGPAAISHGPQTVGGAVDLSTRRLPHEEQGALDAALGAHGYGKLHGFFGAAGPRSAQVIEGVHLRSSGFKELDGGGDTGFSRNEWMWKGRYRLSSAPAASQHLGLKLGYSDEDSRETYLGLTDADLRATPNRRYRASALDRMQWHRTQAVASYQGDFGAWRVDAAAYRHDLTRTWRKVNRLGGAAIADVLANPTSPRNAIYYGVLTGEMDSSGAADTIHIGPNRREFVSQGVQAVAAWRGATGPLSHRLELGGRFHYDRVDRLHTESGFLMRGGELVPDGMAIDTTTDERVWAKAAAFHVADAIGYGRLTVTPGARVELIRTWLRDRLAGREITGEPQNVFMPGVGAHVALPHGLGVLAGVYRGFSPAGAGQDAAVKPETSVNYEAGARWRTARARAEAIGFFNDYSNLTSVCSFATGCAPDRIDDQYNAGRARIFGLETFAQADVAAPGRLTVPVTAAYTLTRTRLRDVFTSEDPTLGQVEAGDELPYVPRHQLTAALGLEHARGGATLGASYSSATRERAGQGAFVPGETTDEIFTLDLTLHVALPGDGDAYLHVRNALGSEALVARRPFGARPIAPRWAQAGARWRF